MTDADTLTPPATGKLTAPAKQWRNKYRALRSYICSDTGHHREGHEYFGVGVWPTRDVAEAKALLERTSVVVLGHAEYLGAFPVTP